MDEGSGRFTGCNTDLPMGGTASGVRRQPKRIPRQVFSRVIGFETGEGMPFLAVPAYSHHPETCSKDRTFVATISGLSPGKRSGFPNHG